MKVSAILFDLEGVLLRAKTHEVLAGAIDLFAFCRQQQLPFGVITNNTVQRPETILKILSERELGVNIHQLLTPLQFLSSELRGVETALVIGSSNLEEFVREHDVEVTTAPTVDVVICGGSYTISNDNLSAAHCAISEHNSRFLCLHRNRVFNDSAGVTRPDVGCLVVGLEYSTGICAKTLGKPSPDYFAKAIENWNARPEEILLISDDPISDLGGGRAMGFQTAFVSTGKYPHDIAGDLKEQPDFCWTELTAAKTALLVDACE